MLSSLVLIIVGLLPLLFGRRLFWLFVGVAGFLIGANLSQSLFPELSEWIQLLLAFFVGLIGAGLAIALQKPMAMVAGFLALGGVGLTIGRQLGAPTWAIWLLFIVLGLIGVVLIYLLFDWALIIGSSANGAATITTGLAGIFTIAGWLNLLILIGLALFGIWFQSRDLVGTRTVVTTTTTT